MRQFNLNELYIPDNFVMSMTKMYRGLKTLLVLFVSIPLAIGIGQSEYDPAINCALKNYGNGYSVTEAGVHKMYKELSTGPLHHLRLKHIGTPQDFLKRYSVPMDREAAYDFVDDMLSGLSEKRIRSLLRRLLKLWC